MQTAYTHYSICETGTCLCMNTPEHIAKDTSVLSIKTSQAHREEVMWGGLGQQKEGWGVGEPSQPCPQPWHLFFASFIKPGGIEVMGIGSIHSTHPAHAIYPLKCTHKHIQRTDHQADRQAYKGVRSLPTKGFVGVPVSALPSLAYQNLGS